MRSIRSPAANAPSSSAFQRTVVTAGSPYCARSLSPRHTTDTSVGMTRPLWRMARSTPPSMRVPMHSTAVGASGRSNSDSVVEYTASTEPPSTRTNSSSTRSPCSACASLKPRTRPWAERSAPPSVSNAMNELSTTPSTQCGGIRLAASTPSVSTPRVGIQKQ